MLSEERQDYIMRQIESDGKVSVQTLVDSLKVSESTIRRDLSCLEDEKKLKRVHGGARRILMPSYEPRFEEKLHANQSLKKAIAQCAAAQVRNGEWIYLDAGTTTLLMIPWLNGIKNLQVVTNSFKHAEICTQYNIPVIIIGGTIKPDTQAVIGATGMTQLQHYHMDRAFLGMNGIDTVRGYTTPDIEEGMIKQTAIQQAAVSYVLADPTKFDQFSSYTVAPLDQAQLITNHLTSRQQQYKKLTTVKEAN